jgi:hypothetical protein
MSESAWFALALLARPHDGLHFLPLSLSSADPRVSGSSRAVATAYRQWLNAREGKDMVVPNQSRLNTTKHHVSKSNPESKRNIELQIQMI